VFGALTQHLDAASRLRLCSWRDNGWTSLLVRLLDNDEDGDVLLPATGEQTLVLNTVGNTTMESRHGVRWYREEYGPGTVGLTAPGNPTQLRWRGTERTLTTHVFLTGNLMDRTATELYGGDAAQVRRPDSLSVDDPLLAAVINGLGAAALAGADELYAETAAMFLAVHLLTRHASIPAPRAPRREDLRVRRAISFIRDNYHRPLTLAEIAASVDLSTFHFLRVFKAAIGQTPYRYLNGVRVGRARRYLEHDELSVTEIAHLCGFATPSRLATAFRAETGLSPSAYRSRWQ
jgi:AraC family transcriptional regulator